MHAGSGLAAAFGYSWWLLWASEAIKLVTAVAALPDFNCDRSSAMFTS